jgi:hypothetical protein
VAKKLLVIFGIAAVAGYLFRDRIAALALDIGARINEIKQFREDDTYTEEEQP